MRLRGRLNQIEKKISALKDEQESTVPVPTGVWFADENGDIIPDSGPATRVPKEEADVFGIMLVPQLCETGQEFEDRYRDMQARQELCQQAMSDPDLTFDEKIAELDLPESFLDHLQGEERCE